MRKRWLWTFILTMSVAAIAVGGEIHVGGAVSGVWTTGTVVFVESPTFVLEGTSLVVEPGVEINISTEQPIHVTGELQIVGRSELPVVVHCDQDGWKGFQFEGTMADNRLEFVYTDSEGGTPDQVVTSTDSKVEIGACKFHATQNCVVVFGGRFRAIENTFVTHGSGSRCVEIHFLEEDTGQPCHNPLASAMHDNLILVDAAGGESPHGISAVGLWIDGSTTMCNVGNMIQMHNLPESGTGVHYGQPTFVGYAWELTDAVIQVSTNAGVARCVNADDMANLVIQGGNLEAIVADSSLYSAIGVSANYNATVVVNTENVVLTGPRPVPWVVREGASITVRYSLRFSEVTGIGNLGAPIEPGESPSLEEELLFEIFEAGGLPNGVTEDGTVIVDQPPLYAMAGDGNSLWESKAQVEAWYSLLEESPCRDAGDPLLEWDPDETAPDIGRYYFDAGEAVDPGIAVPSAVRIHRAYPNPFNPTSTILFDLIRTGEVRVQAYDVLGRFAGMLHSGRLAQGSHSLRFEGGHLASGIYFVEFVLDGQTVGSQKLVLMK